MKRAGTLEPGGLGCAGKKAYPSYTAAFRASRVLRRTQDIRGTSVYRCRCGGWHVGSGQRAQTGPVTPRRLNHRGEYVERKPRLSNEDAEWLTAWFR